MSSSMTYPAQLQTPDKQCCIRSAARPQRLRVMHGAIFVPAELRSRASARHIRIHITASATAGAPTWPRLERSSRSRSSKSSAMGTTKQPSR